MKDRSKSLWIRYGLVNHHACDGLAVFFLFGRVYTMRFEIHRQSVHGVLHVEILYFSIVVRSPRLSLISVLCGFVPWRSRSLSFTNPGDEPLHRLKAVRQICLETTFPG